MTPGIQNIFSCLIWVPFLSDLRKDLSLVFTWAKIAFKPALSKDMQDSNFAIK